MSIRFIVGRSGVGKTRVILDEIKQALTIFPIEGVTTNPSILKKEK